MAFEDFVNFVSDIKTVYNAVSDRDIYDIKEYIGFIEKKLDQMGRKGKEKLYSLIEDAINKIPEGCIADLTAKTDLGYIIAPAWDLLDDNGRNGDVYEFLDDNHIYVVANGKGFVKLIELSDLRESNEYKHIINKLVHKRDLILNEPDIPDFYKEPIRKIENLFKLLGVEDKKKEE